MAICKYCGEEISWQNTPNGYKAVDLEPEFVIECRGGDVFLDDEGEEVRGRLARPDEVDTREKKLDTPVLSVPHARTCKAMNRRRSRQWNSRLIH